MAFTVEDGTGVADANSYVTVAFANSYFTERSITTWTGADAVKEAALIRATDYIEGRFGESFIGTSTTDTQGLHFPVSDIDWIEDDEIPVKLKRALCEYALRALTITLAPDPVVDDSGVTVVTVKSKLGPLEEAFQVVGSAYPQLLRAYPAADMLLSRYLKATQGRVIR